MRPCCKRSASILLYALLLLAGCAGATPAPVALPTMPDVSQSPTASPAATVPPTPQVAIAALPEPSMGTNPAAVPEQRLVIGIQSPLSGPEAALGVGLRNGAELAALQLVRPLTDLGLAVELRSLDDQGSPEVAAANAAELASDAATRCVVGHLDSPATRGALPAYAEAKLPLVVPVAGGVGLTESFSNTVRLVGRDDVQGAIAARFAHERLKAATSYVVQERSDYGEVLASAFKRRAEANGLRVIGQGLLGDEGLAAAVSAAAPDVVYLAAGYAQAGPLIKQLREAGLAGPLLGPDALDSSELPRLAGGALGEFYYTTLAVPVGELPLAVQFANDYEARFASNAPAVAAQAYDAVAVCVAALARAAEQARGMPSRAQVAGALVALGSYEGIAGTYRFTPAGDLAQAPYFVFRASPHSWPENTVVVRLMAPPPGA